MGFYAKVEDGITTVSLRKDSSLGSNELFEYINSLRVGSPEHLDPLMRVITTSTTLLSDFYEGGGVLALDGDFLINPLSKVWLSDSLSAEVSSKQLVEGSIKRLEQMWKEVLDNDEEIPGIVLPESIRGYARNKKIILAASEWASRELMTSMLSPLQIVIRRLQQNQFTKLGSPNPPLIVSAAALVKVALSDYQKKVRT
jgi:hypothetical protein